MQYFGLCNLIKDSCTHCNIKKITVLFIFLLSIVIVLSGCTDDTSEDPSWENIKNKGSLVIGISENNLPLTYRNSSGNIAGFDIEVATEVCRRLSLKGDIMAIQPSEMVNMLENGTIDCYWSGLPQTGRGIENPYSATSPYLRNDDIFLLPIKSTIKNMAQFKKKKVGVLAGTTGKEALENAKQFYASLEKVEIFDTIEDAFSAINTGNVDALVISETLARYFMNLNPDRYQIMLQDNGESCEPLDNHNCVIAIRNGENALRKKLDNALDSMHNDGKIQELTERWFGNNIAIRPDND